MTGVKGVRKGHGWCEVSLGQTIQGPQVSGAKGAENWIGFEVPVAVRFLQGGW